MKAVRLLTEYLQNPMGIDITAPRLFWNCEEGITQTAYQIVVKDDAGDILWDSGKVASGSMRAMYGGAPLHSRSRAHWQVRLWDETDTPGGWGEGAFFELGLLKAADWKAAWISGDYTPVKKRRYPVDCFCTAFSAKRVRKARLYATACGVYEGELNGKRIGNYILAPGITDYTKRVQYQTYDVTELLAEGENRLAFGLADGWYRGSVGAWGLRNQYGTQTKLLAQLELTLEDGSVQTICTDGSWRWSNDGPIRFADNKDGEVVEAARQPTYSGRVRVTNHVVQPTAANNDPITEHEAFAPALIQTPQGGTVLDFGQNIAGYVRFTVQARAGQVLRLRFGEMLDEAGEFTQKNIQCSNKKITTPLQQVEYTCKQGENHYKTRFAIFGFRYVLVETEVAFRQEDFTAIAVYTDMEQTVEFTSSNPLLNQFVDCTLWSAKGNSADLPTDCPTRERHGWTGDAQLFFTTGAYMFRYAPFARKYVRDMFDWQRADGCLPQIVPPGGVDAYMNPMNGSVGWADAGVMIPYRYWKQYGDRQMLADCYDAMRRYALFMQKRCGRRYPTAKRLPLAGKAKRYVVNYGQSYGEWAEPADVHPNHWTDAVRPHPEVSTAYTCHVMQLMEEIALELGRPEDAAEYREYARGTRYAYRMLVKLPAFTLDTDRQAQLVRPLYFRLLDEKQAGYAKKRLVQALEHYGWRLGTGFLSTPLILDVLADIDIEYAYRLLENEEMPGWLFMPKNGATTVWEAWEGTEAQNGIASLNHYSKGAVCDWLFRVMCGIQVSGENHFTVAPRPGGSFAHASTRYNSIYGPVTSGWRREEGKTVYTITIPAGCTAGIHLPDGTQKQVTAGDYIYSV